MNFRFTAILFAAVVLGIGTLALVTYFDKGDAGAEGLVAPLTSTGLKETDIDTVELVRTEPADEKLVFRKIGEGKWELKQPIVAKVDSFAIDGLVRMLFNTKPTRYPGSMDNPGALGLGKPTVRITLKRGDTAGATVNIGDTTIGGNDAFTFVSTGENPNRAIALRTLDLRPLFREAAAGKDGAAWTLSKWITDFRTRRLLGADVTNPDTGIDAFSVSRGGASIKLSKTADGWKFDEPANFGDADTAGDSVPRADLFTGVRPLLNALITLSPAGIGDYIEGASAADLTAWGLADGDPTAIRVELKPKGAAAPEVLLIGKKVEKDGKPVVPGKVYCRMVGDTAAITVATDRLDAIASTIANPSEMRNKDLVPETKKEFIDAIDVVQGAASFKLRRISTTVGATAQWAIYGATPDGRWATYVGSGDPADPRASVSKLIEALTKPRAAKAVLLPNSPESTAAFAATTATVKVWYGALPANTPIAGDTVPAEPVLKGDPVTFTLGKVDKDIAYLRRTAGASVDFQIPLDLVDRLLRPRMDYVDPRAGTFKLETVTKVAFNRGAVAYEIVRAGPPEKNVNPLGRWEFAKPESTPKKNADGEMLPQMLFGLAAQQNAKLITDTPSADELTRWGLAAPRLKATVSQDKAPDRTYEFGADTDDKKSVYFRVAGQPFVFTAPKELFDLYASADLRDRVLFRFDAAKIKRLEITAWKNASVTKKPIVLKLEREGNAWVAKEPQDFPLDTDKVMGLLKVLEAPRTQEYLPASNPEMALDPNLGGFQILIVPETGRAEFLRIGKPDANPKYVYAEGSSFEGVAKVEASFFRNYAEQPESLRK